jgi:hypothetical protein
VETPEARELRDKMEGNGASKPARTYDAAQCAEECALKRKMSKKQLQLGGHLNFNILKTSQKQVIKLLEGRRRNSGCGCWRSAFEKFLRKIASNRFQSNSKRPLTKSAAKTGS